MTAESVKMLSHQRHEPLVWLHTKLLIWLCVECTIYWLPKKKNNSIAWRKKNPLHFGFLFIPPVMALSLCDGCSKWCTIKKVHWMYGPRDEKLIFHNGIKMLFGWDLGRFQQKLQIIKINFYGKMGSLLGRFQQKNNMSI